jgi:hypothetical protein
LIETPCFRDDIMADRNFERLLRTSQLPSDFPGIFSEIALRG